MHSQFINPYIMKYLKYLIPFIIIGLVSLTSCNRSEFATTIKHQRGGKTTYTKQYKRNPVRINGIATNYAKPKKKSDKRQKIDQQYALTDRFHEIPSNKSVESQANRSTNNLIASTSSNSISVDFHKTKVEPLPNISNPKTKRTHTPDTIRGNVRKNIYADHAVGDTRRTEKLGLAGFILTLIGWVLAYGLPLSILGVIFGSISLAKIRRNPQRFKGRGFAITSLILGIIGVVVGIIALILL